MENYILELENIGKTFSGVNVLRGINFKLKKGEVHALLGENGAGKSTLIKILSGYHQPDKGGTIKINGKVVAFKNPKEALRASIHTIYQELTLCPRMTVAENIVIDKQNSFNGFIQNNKEFSKITSEVMEQLGQPDIKPNTIVNDLSIAQRQVVEIAKAITSKAQIILMDEPTSSISQEDTEKLMKIIKSLKENGISIIYISHRLHEIRGIADSVTVLRDGNMVGTKDIKDIDDQEVINMMVGRNITNIYPKKNVVIGESVLRIENLSSENDFKDISFEVHKGEIFGIGGLVGAKRTELMETIFGMRKISSGKIYLKGVEFVPRSPINAIRNKIAFITEDRKKTGLIQMMPVIENLNIVNMQEKTPLGYVKWKKYAEIGERLKEILNIKLNSLSQAVSTLSGGNQQKVVLGKWMNFKPDVILFDEPTRGIDIGAKTEIYNIMGDWAASGAAVIMVSSELPELISVADRIMVMHEGRMKGIISRDEASQEKVMQMATARS